ncbi:iron ABC transporter substrate-binding protein [[Pantoea] beijingensis]|uniref:Iron ABC transporter substrate-binding protein n=1 Tax=[Pantoea] beijingensis TaxID=1324864 RepID=A0A443IF52_9GAMM|nr:extracellular solute-binding protein [[Pantoea] beijingensis]RWR02703.1 iron ABC transporter substrate-binding protein [[Pantoea] beijingensis]
MLKNCLLVASLLLGMLIFSSAHAEPLNQRFATLYAAAKPEKDVVFYNTFRQDTNRKLVSFWKANFPDITLKIVQKQSLDLIPTIESERAAGKTLADVVMINEIFVANAWKEKGWFVPYKVGDFDRLPAQYKDPDGSWYITSVSLLTAAYNTRAFPDKSQLPKSLQGFTEAKWKGKLLLGDPKVAASNQAFFLALLKSGKLNWDMLNALSHQDILFTRGNADSARLIATGERLLSPMVSSQNVITAREKGQPIDFYVLDEGAILVTQPVGIFAHSPHPNGGKLLMETLASKEGQELVAAAGAYWPTHPDAEAPGHLPKLDTLKPESGDVAVGGAESQAFLARFGEIFNRH